MQNQETTNNAVNLIRNASDFCLDLRAVFNDLTKELQGCGGKSKTNVLWEFFHNKDSWIWLECYVKNEVENMVSYFCMVVAVGTDDTINLKESNTYLEFMNILNIDTEIPLLLFYGKFKPIAVKNSDPAQWWQSYLRCRDDYLEFFGNFDIGNIGFNKEIVIKTNDWTNQLEDKSLPSYDKWFSEAKIKIKPILSIQGRKDVVDIAEELKQMTI